MKSIRLALAAVVALPLVGCCTKSLKIKPQAEVISGKVVASADIDFVFERCLSKEEKAQAIRIKEGLTRAFEQFESGKIDQQRYNAINEAAQSGLRKVIYFTGTEGPGYAKVSSQRENLAKIADTIEASLQKPS